MINLPSAICVAVGLIFLGLYGFNWYYLMLVVAGILIFQYVPEKDRSLYIKQKELENEKLFLENLLLKEKVSKVK